MGEIADMMLDGFLDEETGEYIDGDSPGFPRRMSDPDMYSAGPSPHRTAAQQVTRRAKNKRKRDRQKANRAARNGAPPAA